MFSLQEPDSWSAIIISSDLLNIGHCVMDEMRGIYAFPFRPSLTLMRLRQDFEYPLNFRSANSSLTRLSPPRYFDALMNADAYLKRHGWKGTGHSLDHTGRGIKKPLLVSHKQDQSGLGHKKAAHRVDDQWWLRAFDDSLKSIGTGQEV
jgi:hypothetical protein